MKIGSWSDRVEEFERANSDLPSVTDDGVIIHCVETLSGPLRICIDVGEGVTGDELKKAIPLALEHRDRLLEFQGRTGLYSNDFLLGNIDRDHKSMRKSRRRTYASYASIAESINQKISEWMYENSGLPAKLDSEPSLYKKTLDFYLRGAEAQIPDPLERIRELLRLFRFEENQIEEFILEGSENIRAGYQPISQGYPVSRRKIILVLEWWRKYESNRRYT
jgi:hypothetical protein